MYFYTYILFIIKIIYNTNSILSLISYLISYKKIDDTNPSVDMIQIGRCKN